MKQNDGLLRVTSWLLKGILGFLILGGLFSSIVTLALAFDLIPLDQNPPSVFAGATPQQVLQYFYTIVPLAVIAIVCAASFVILLLKIIDSVKLGTPFVVTNADRLARMGWLAIIFQLLALLISWLEHSFLTSIGQAPVFDLDIAGILLGLVLFILARVFRIGRNMQDDLEGTV